jgi:BlaI family transcriptional regulator, penicillinase repressor
MFRSKKRRALSPLENETMNVLWSQGRATADDVRQALGKTREFKESTVRTLLRRLEAKGYAEHDVEARTYVYRPKVEQKDVATQAIRGIIERFCAGSVESLLAGMVDGDLITPTRLRELADKIAEAERGRRPPQKRRNVK